MWAHTRTIRYQKMQTPMKISLMLSFARHVSVHRSGSEVDTLPVFIRRTLQDFKISPTRTNTRPPAFACAPSLFPMFS